MRAIQVVIVILSMFLNFVHSDVATVSINNVSYIIVTTAQTLGFFTIDMNGNVAGCDNSGCVKLQNVLTVLAASPCHSIPARC